MKGLIFTYVLAFGGTLLGLFRPFAGLLIYIAFAILKPDALWEFSVPKGNYSRMVMIAVLVGWALSFFGNWRFGRARVIVVALISYLLAMCVSAFAAPDQVLAWDMVEATAKILLPVLVGLTLIDSTDRLRQVAWTVVLSQGYLAYEFNTSYYDGFNRLVTVGFASMDEKTVSIDMVVAASVAIFLGLSSQRRIQQAVAFFAAILMIHVPLFAFSRGGMISLLVSAVVAFWFVPKRPRHLVVVVVAILIGFRLAGNEVRTKFMTSFAAEENRDDSAQSRVELWGQAFETMVTHPLTGVGPRHWGGWARSHYGWEGNKEAHNTWLQAGAELGIPGLVALLTFFLAPILLLLPMARGRPGDTQAEGDLARMVVCGLAGYLVASQFITVYGVEGPYFVAMMGGGLLHIRGVRAAAEHAASHALRWPAAPGRGATQVGGATQRPLGAVVR